MQKLDLADVTEYVEQNIGTFHEKRLKGLETLKLDRVLKRKNPYLFKAKSMLTAQDIVKALIDAHLSSQEETFFGEFLEGLAIFICEKVYGGRKISTVGIDLDFDKDGVRYLVSIKSGPNWGNKGQIDKMKIDFNTAIKTLNTNSSMQKVICVNGCCYGRDGKPDKGIYLKYCGQNFWTLISGDETLYTQIIEPLGYEAKERNEEFHVKYIQMVNKFTRDFIQDYCTPDGEINWKMILELNSSRDAPALTKRRKSTGRRKKTEIHQMTLGDDGDL